MSTTTKESLTEQLLKGPVEITYKKQSDSDTVHTITGTLVESEIEKYAPGSAASADSKDDGVVRFIAPDRKGWRSVRISSIQSVA